MDAAQVFVMATISEMSTSYESSFQDMFLNLKYGFLDGKLRGYVGDLLDDADYVILAECETLDDVVSYLVSTADSKCKMRSSRCWTPTKPVECNRTQQDIKLWRDAFAPIRACWDVLEIFRIWLQHSSFSGGNAKAKPTTSAELKNLVSRRRNLYWRFWTTWPTGTWSTTFYWFWREFCMGGTHRHGLTLRFTTSNALSAGAVVYSNFCLQELIEKCHPLGMFDSIVTLPVATNMPWVNVDGKTSCHQNSKDWLTADFPPPQWSLQTCTCGHSTRIVFWWLYDNKLGRVEHRIIAKYCLQGRNFKHKTLVVWGERAFCETALG